jgi:hypothetical protein
MSLGVPNNTSKLLIVTRERLNLDNVEDFFYLFMGHVIKNLLFCAKKVGSGGLLENV